MAETTSSIEGSSTALDVFILLPEDGSTPVLFIAPMADRTGRPASQVIRGDEKLVLPLEAMFEQMIAEEDPQDLIDISAFLIYQAERMRSSAVRAMNAHGDEGAK